MMKDMPAEKSTGAGADKTISSGAPTTNERSGMAGGGGETPPMTNSTVGSGGSSKNDVSMPKGFTDLTCD